MNVILLSGGSGTRLWPLSNEVRSKQFLKILRNEDGNPESMVQRMYRMIKNIDPDSKIVIATSDSQVPSIKNQLGENVCISIEPCRRDTFPAIALSTAYLHQILGVNLNDSVVVCPVDPLVEVDYFNIIKKMYESTADDSLLLMGIKPTYPSEKYGYIIPCGDSVYFKEKPNEQDAETYINNGAYWNGGVFGFKISYLLKKTKSLLGTCDYYDIYNQYPSLPRISFDYAVVENEKNIHVIEYSGEWKDLGTWNTFTEAMSEFVGKNAVLGENCSNVHVVNELSIPIIGLGLKNIVIAASPDGILVSDKEASSYLKKYVPKNRPMFEKREWGEYKVLDYQVYEDGTKSLTKELIILPGKSISYEKHLHRKENWNIIKGSGLLALNGKLTKVSPGDVVCINAGDLHSVKSVEELRIIEVQTGESLTEEDVQKDILDSELFES